MNFPVDTLCPSRLADRLRAPSTPLSTAPGVDIGDRCFNRGVQRLFPTPEVGIDPADLYGALVRPRPTDRPWVELCMITSVDGTTTAGGTSGALGSTTDTAVLAALRRSADVIIVGSTTAHAERYRAPKKSGQRVGVVTASGNIDPTLPLFDSGAGFLITTRDAPSHGLDVIRSTTTAVDLSGALAQLDVAMVHAEGGPTLNAALLALDLVDEVNLTIAPQLVGGAGHRLAAPSPDELPRHLELAHVCNDGNYLFLRYVRAIQRGSTTR